MAQYRYKINGHTYNIIIGAETGGKAEVTVNGKSYIVERQAIATTANPAPTRIPEPTGEASLKATAPLTPAATPSTQAAAPVPSAAHEFTVTSPLPGTITAIKVKPGDKVTENQIVAILEAMKMENEIEAGYAGTVTSVRVAERDTVLEGAVLITISK